MIKQSTVTPIEPFKLTSADEWKKSRIKGYPVRFPSGNTALLRPVGMATLIRLGRLPSFINAFRPEDLRADGSMILGDLSKIEVIESYYALLDAIAETCMVSPSIENGEITLDDMLDEDKLALYRWFIMPAEKLNSFRPNTVIVLSDIRIGAAGTDDSQQDVEGATMVATASEGDA